MTINSGFAVNIPSADLEPDPLDPAQIVSGNPEVSGLVLSETDTVVRGIWQHTPGVSTDTESDEMFVVVSGRAMIEFFAGDTDEVESKLDLGPGDVCVLTEGARTRWTIFETLRKAYAIQL